MYKEDLALNNRQKLTHHKNKPNHKNGSPCTGIISKYDQG